MNKTNYIDVINLVLILLAAGLAFLMPFQTFIIAYLVIGPLHYLTETQWLKNQGFFLENKKWGILFLICAILLIAFIQLEESELFNNVVTSFFDLWSNALIYFAFIISAVLVLVRNNLMRILTLLTSLALLLLLNNLSAYHIIIGILLPTIVHVYIFTLLFMIYGWKKQKTKIGLINIGLLFTSPIIIFLPVDQTSISSGLFNDLFLKSGFQNLNLMIENWLHLSSSDGLSASGRNPRVQSFLAFIYLYHYLNWFSKTTQIKWHKALKNRSIIIISLIWIAIIGLYFINFKLGLVIAVLFSYIHVFMEFPLNIKTFTSLTKRQI
ncbi:MAG: hypothetical protein HWE07_04970 [Cytophagia bacterium]|nr:hypothetical protein [Cytophagia bacterium]NVK43758.1 hypothetical protein [Oceanospirillaceae bacterium]